MESTLDERAEQARSKLFKRYDQLNALWEKAEEQLTRFHIPRPVYHEIETAHDSYDCPICTYSLCIVKVKGKWRICYEEDGLRGSDSVSLTPITECSVMVRVKCVEHLTQLRENIVETAENFIPKVDEAVDKLRQFLDVDIQELLAERAKLNGKAK